MSRRKDLYKQGLSMPMLDRLLRRSNLEIEGLEIRLVQTVEELTTAASLVYDEYLRCGYIAPNKNRWKISLFQTLPSTVTFIAVLHKKHILGTVSLVEDTPLGLPSDHIYKQDFDDLRLKKHHLAEFTMLALNRSLLESKDAPIPMSHRLLIMLKLISGSFAYLRSATSVDEIVAVFHPRHDGFYEFMQLDRLGEEKNHAGVKGNPALARHFYFPEKIISTKDHICYRFFFVEKGKPENYARRLCYTEEDMRQLFVEHSNILSSANARQLEYIQQCYPSFDLDKLIHSKNLIMYLEEALEIRRAESQIKRLA